MSLASAIAKSLTGVALELAADSPTEIAAALQLAGWGSTEIMRHRQLAFEQGRSWPAPIDPELRAGVGAAQAKAALQEVVQLMQLGDQPRIRDRSQPLTKTDLALLAEVPPHHGQVG